ncbi:sulfatase [Vibrio sp. FNV 38]|nr:sulfatase [Vibrio sp. FNV 38]
MINRRQFISGTAALVAASTFPNKALLNTIQSSHTNVLMIAIDDLNDWIGPLGGHPQAKTPNLDRLASKATVFSNAHASAPLCGPSRASLMTGLAPSTTGIYGHVEDDDIKSANDKASSAIFLSEYFGQHGYYTAGVGKLFHKKVAAGSFENYGGRVNGFGPYPEKTMKWHKEGTSTDWGAFPDSDEQMPDYEYAQWLIDQLQMTHDRPFFMAGGFIRPHVPWHVPQKWFDLYPVEELELPPYLPADLDDVPELAKLISDYPQMPTTEWAIENDEWRYIVQGYLACVSFVDSCIGRVLDALERSPYAENTAIVLWGDHGYQLGEKSKFSKMALWERATRTPLIIKVPNLDNPQVVDKPVSLLDIYPTLLSISGLPKNSLNEGNDLTPLILNPGHEWPHVATTTFGPNNHSVKSERYRYTRYADGSEELYDHSVDSNEWLNLASAPNYTAIKKELIEMLPKYNADWSPVSFYTGNPYFKNLTLEARQDLLEQR